MASPSSTVPASSSSPSSPSSSSSSPWSNWGVAGVVGVGALLAYAAYRNIVNSKSNSKGSTNNNQGKVVLNTEELLNYATVKFQHIFNNKPSHAAMAPGRVNLIGEHIDYNDGCVLPMAIDRATVVVGRFNGLSKYRIYSEDANDEEKKSSDRPYSEFTVDDINQITKYKAWHNYVRGVIAEGNEVGPFDAVIVSNVPLGGGLSSSASLEVAVATLIESLLELDPASLNNVYKASVCRSAEHKYAHVPCGIMDQYISCCALKNHALLIDCDQLEKSKQVPFNDPKITVLITNSNVKHELNSGEYEKRAKQCKEALNKLVQKFNCKHNWRGVTMEMVESLRDELGILLFKRARHVVGEINRTIKAAECLEQGNYKEFGKLMYLSHESLKEDYEVSCEELDVLVKLASKCEGVYGARMTGGGFGGCTVTLVESDKVEACMDVIRSGYEKHFHILPAFIISSAAQGAQILKI